MRDSDGCAKRVAAYCRVSTDKNDQANSLDSQQRYFQDYIARNSLWTLSGVYVDEGITGTSTRKRHAFNRMILDAEAGKVDLIITKEISRFARNTLDSILYTRKLKDLGVGVIFLNDNINTLDADAELRLTIMSSIAQEESRKTSDRVKWGQKRRMEQGVVFGRDLLGYDVRGGKLYVNEAGAETVRLIFHKFVNEEKGTHVIARELREEGIETAAYLKKWSNTAILRILRNEKYCGDLIQKKTITPSYLNHEKKPNRGEEEMVVIRGHHTPIISREMFEQAQWELQRRSCEAQKAKHSSRYAFSGKIKCGNCGCSFVARSKRRKSGAIYKAWRCYEAARHGAPHMDKAGNKVGCCGISINDGEVKRLLQEVVKVLPIDRQKAADDLMKIISQVVDEPANDKKTQILQKRLTDLDRKKKRLLELYLERDVSKEDYKEMKAVYDSEIEILKDELAEAGEEKISGQGRENMLTEICNTLYSIAEGRAWDDVFYRKLLDKIIVTNYFESGANDPPVLAQANTPDGFTAIPPPKLRETALDLYITLIPVKWRFLALSPGDLRPGMPIHVKLPYTGGFWH